MLLEILKFTFVLLLKFGNAILKRLFKPDKYVSLSKHMTLENKLKKNAKTSKLTANKEIQKKLFIELKILRKQIADQESMPAYKVFNDKTLTQMSKNMPTSESEMLKVYGVGPVKMHLYGNDFLRAIKEFEDSIATAGTA